MIATCESLIDYFQYDTPPPTTATAAGSGRKKRKVQGGTWVNAVIPFEFDTTLPRLHNGQFTVLITRLPFRFAFDFLEIVEVLDIFSKLL